MIAAKGKKCPNKQHEINTVTDSECLTAGEGLGFIRQNDTGKSKWTGPGAFSACLVKTHDNENDPSKTEPTPNSKEHVGEVIVNPKPFKTNTNLNFQPICREQGNRFFYYEDKT